MNNLDPLAGLNARHPRTLQEVWKTSSWLPTQTYFQPQARITFPNRIQPTQPNKVPDVKEWAYTLRQQLPDSSGKGATGAGTYHPSTSTPSFVEPNGMGITNTINRAELAAITAAFLHCHSHTTSDSLSAPPNQEALVVHWASPPPRTRGFFEGTQANYSANYPQLTKPCAIV